MMELFRNIKKWLIANPKMIFLFALVCFYIVLSLFFKCFRSSIAAEWVGNISVVVAIAQLLRQHQDSVDQLEFEKQKQKPKAEVFVNYVKDVEENEKYIECSLVNVGYEAGIYKFVGVYPLDKLKESQGAIDKIEIYRIVNQNTFVRSLKGDSIQDFDTIASTERLGPMGIFLTITNGINYIGEGKVMVAVFQDIEDKLIYKTFRYDKTTDSLERGDKTKTMKMKR